MKRTHVAPLAVLAGALVVAGMAFAASPDRSTLKTPNGIAYSEFEGYETWQAIAPAMTANAGGCGASPEPGCIKLIAGNTKMIEAYRDGFPGNGKPIPDGAVMVKFEWEKKVKRPPESAYELTVPGKFRDVSFMMKDSTRFPKTNGWGYAAFRYDTATDTLSAFGAGPEFANACHACHTAFAKARDWVFTDYPQR